MKTVLICCLFSIFLVSSVRPSATYAQRSGYWTNVKIPVDSVWPYSLNFVDSLNGYLDCVRWDYGGEAEYNHWYFRTTDAGRTWQQITFGSVLSGKKFTGGSYKDPNYGEIYPASATTAYYRAALEAQVATDP